MRTSPHTHTHTHTHTNTHTHKTTIYCKIKFCLQPSTELHSFLYFYIYAKPDDRYFWPKHVAGCKLNIVFQYFFVFGSVLVKLIPPDVDKKIKAVRTWTDFRGVGEGGGRFVFSRSALCPDKLWCPPSLLSSG
jgi:hypothetical protein